MYARFGSRFFSSVLYVCIALLSASCTDFDKDQAAQVAPEVVRDEPGMACTGPTPIIFENESAVLSFNEDLEGAELDLLADPTLYYEDTGTVDREGLAENQARFTAPNQIPTVRKIPVSGFNRSHQATCYVLMAPTSIGSTQVSVYGTKGLEGPFTRPTLHFFKYDTAPDVTDALRPADADAMLIWRQLDWTAVVNGFGLADGHADDQTQYAVLINFTLVNSEGVQNYFFDVDAASRAFMTVDGAPFIDSSTNNGRGNTVLGPGAHEFSVRYFHLGGGGTGTFKLRWGNSSFDAADLKVLTWEDIEF